MKIHLTKRIKSALLIAAFAVCALFLLAAAALLSGSSHFAQADSEAYYAVLSGVTPSGSTEEINGSTAYLLTESDSRYVSGQYFVSSINTTTKYTVYRKETSSGGTASYVKTLEGTVDEADKGYYTFNYDPSHIYSTGAYADMVETDFGGWYMSDNTNNYLYSSSGKLRLDEPKKFREVEEDDPEYSRVYTQYKLNITVEAADLEGGYLTFCITNGKDVYKAGDDYAVISEEGVYRIIFCENRTYDGGYHYVVKNRLAVEEDADYYLCLSTQNYAVLKTNVLTLNGSYEYVIENVTLSSSVKFRICDENGSVWYDKDGEEMSVTEEAEAAYDIKFSPSAVYSNQTEWASTSCHITYKKYSPASYSLTVNSDSYKLNYNSSVSGRDEYYISSMYLYSGDALSVSGYSQTYTVSANGYYRILFTPGETKSGDYYCYDENGSYGTGTGYSYNIYVEKAPLYYAVFTSGAAALPTSSVTIDGAAAYLLTRDESATLETYKSDELFVGETEFLLKVRVYEYIASSSSYKEITLSDDGFTAEYVGWYTLGFVPGGSAYAYISEKGKDFGGYYISGSFNGYCFTYDGEVSVSSDYKFGKIAEDDDDYTEDYVQYVLYVDVSARAAREGGIEFYITDGEERYTNAGEYITLSAAGRYKILFSAEHIYGRGRYYRYTLESSSADKDDLEISSADEFAAFAAACNADAEYSVGLSVYITADIDFSGKDAVSVKLFCGYLNGGYHTLKNITINCDEGDNVGVFGVLSKSATVERLTVENLNITAEDSSHVGFVGENYGSVRLITISGNVSGKSYVGSVVGYNGRSAVESGDAVEDSSEGYIYAKIEKCKSTCSVVGKINVGGIAGYSGGKIINCAFSGESNAVAHSSSDRIVNTGGIVGYSTGVIDSCTNDGPVGYTNTGIYVGGIVGFSSGEVYFSTNTAAVNGNAYTGGIAGYLGSVSSESSSDSLSSYFGGMSYEDFVKYYFSDDGEDFSVEADGGVYVIIYCINSGAVTSESYAGGIVGCISAESSSGTTITTITMSSTSSSSDTSATSSTSDTSSTGSTTVSVRVEGCASSGDVYSSAGNYAGGIAGRQRSGEILSCLSAGTIKAEGISSGGYVGGIVGDGVKISYCVSVCSLSGSSYVGGIAGYAEDTLIGCYTDCVILTPDALHVGLIAGAAAAYVPATGDFGDKVSDNFFVGSLGGVDGMNYGALYDNAACALTAENLVSVGELSPYLSLGFSSDYWCGASVENGYPFLKAFEEAVECSSYGSEADFESAFLNVKESLSALSAKYCVRSYTVTFLEWNEDEGDLYDDDGALNEDNFDVIYTARLRYGEELSYPSFVYAKAYGDRFIYDGDKASYFVSWGATDPFAEDNTLLFATYTEVFTTLSDEESLVLAEGKFEDGEEVAIEYSGEYFTLKFSKDGNEIDESGITVKLKSEKASSAEIYKVEGQNLVKQDSVVSGGYVSFTYDGGYYAIVYSSASLPAWAFALIGVGGTLIALAAAAGIVFLVRKKRSAKDEAKGEKGE